MQEACKDSVAVVHDAQHSTAHDTMHAPEAAKAAAETELSAAPAPHTGGADEPPKVAVLLNITKQPYTPVKVRKRASVTGCYFCVLANLFYD